MTRTQVEQIEAALTDYIVARCKAAYSIEDDVPKVTHVLMELALEKSNIVEKNLMAKLMEAKDKAATNVECPLDQISSAFKEALSDRPLSAENTEEQIAVPEQPSKDGKCADWQSHRKEILRQVQKVIAEELA